MTEKAGGVLISDGRSSVRLSRAGPPNELEYPTIIDVRAGPFQGSVLDETVGVGGFRGQLATLYESLKGDAKLGSYDRFVDLAIPRIRGLRRVLTDDEQQTVAREIVEYLELRNWISP